jgi:urate oxidase
MLADSAYGKNRVRLVQVTRRGDRHDLADVTVDIRFQGDYDASYLDGQNADVLPTDTMKNTVYALAASERVRAIETFGMRLAERFITCNPRLRRVRIDLAGRGWNRIAVGDRPHGQAFLQTGPEVRTARVLTDREGPTISAGVKDLLILKSGHSSFTGFLRDELTTLPETTDRILATSLRARWTYREAGVDFDASWQAVRKALLETFAEHHSESVQHTLYAMGQAVLDAVDDVVEIRLVMPNKHHLPVDLSRLSGLPNRNEIFVATDEPFGRIEATLVRN